MLRLASDADLDGAIIKALRKRQPALDLVRVQEVGLRNAADPVILEWGAKEGRIVLTHDRKTMTKHAKARVAAEQPMPGIFVVPQLPDQRGELIEEILMVVNCSVQDEWKDRVEFLPL